MPSAFELMSRMNGGIRLPFVVKSLLSGDSLRSGDRYYRNFTVGSQATILLAAYFKSKPKNGYLDIKDIKSYIACG